MNSRTNIALEYINKSSRRLGIKIDEEALASSNFIKTLPKKNIIISDLFGISHENSGMNTHNIMQQVHNDDEWWRGEKTKREKTKNAN